MAKFAFFVTFLASASAAVLSRSDIPTGAPKLPLSAFESKTPHIFTPEELVAIVENGTQEAPHFEGFQGIAATCSNPRIRPEWHRTDSTYKQKFVNAVKCLLRNPSKGYPGSTNRYEDFVQVHQQVADNVHNNRKFLVWHRAYLWAFEEALRNECGFTESLPWFDETNWAGRFAASDVFSSKWFGGIAVGGNCVKDGQFPNLAAHIGPGKSKQPYCISRNGNADLTKQCNKANVETCRRGQDYQTFALCEEGGVHMYGHNGIGGAMRDFYSSPSDPIFWLHHGMVDRHFRIWQNNDKPSRVNYINGNGPDKKPLTMDTGIFLSGLKPDLKVRDIMNTMGGFLCYKYDY